MRAVLDSTRPLLQGERVDANVRQLQRGLFKTERVNTASERQAKLA